MDIINSTLTFAEQCVRQLYFRSPALRRLRAKPMEAPARKLDPETFEQTMQRAGVQIGSSVMVHAALAKIRVIEGPNGAEVVNPIKVAECIISAIRRTIGESGTILMPAFPKYPNEPDYFDFSASIEDIQTFDPLRTKSRSGILSEVFRKQKSTLRSEFPVQTVCAQGPLAAFYIDRNIEDGEGLAHGPNSPYGRLVSKCGHVISIGVPLIDFATIIHAPEDARFATWPRRDFWRTRLFNVLRANGMERVKVLERDPRYSLGYGEERVRRDLKRNGILHEYTVDTVEVHSMRADVMFNFFMQQNSASTYPYFWPAVSVF